jgi:hypothetical protein
MQEFPSVKPSVVMVQRKSSHRCAVRLSLNQSIDFTSLLILLLSILMKNLSDIFGRMFDAELPQERVFCSVIVGLALIYLVLSLGNSSAACSESNQESINPVMIDSVCR